MEISIRIVDVSRECLTLNLTNDTIALNPCNGEMNQQWTFAYINETAYEKFDDIFGYSSIIHL